MNSRNLFKAIIPATFILLATACDKHPDILGTWTATPTRINNMQQQMRCQPCQYHLPIHPRAKQTTDR